jgi:hypothetical protein
LNGLFDYSKTCITPPGAHVLVHEKLSRHGTRDALAVDACNIDPTNKQYRCYKVWIWGMWQEHIMNTLLCFPMQVVVQVAASPFIWATLPDLHIATQYITFNIPKY